MKTLEIFFSDDYYDCEQDGCSGGNEAGIRAVLDGETILDLVPKAGCFDNRDESACLVELFRVLGYEAVFDWEYRDED